MTTISADLGTAADRLWQAQVSRVPCAPVRGLLPDLAAAYAVQGEVLARRLASGATVVGRKIGLTSAAIQAQLGVDTPDVGVLLDEMDLPGDRPVPVAGLLQPRIEAEIAFVLGADLGADPSAEDVRDATAYVVVALEICDSRIKGWDIGLLDTVADNASSAAFVLGGQRHALGELDLRSETMSLACDGEVVSSGIGSDCLGDPVRAVVWLARTAAELGAPLTAGEVVLSGALGPMVAVQAGRRYEARASRLGSVAISFEEEST